MPVKFTVHSVDHTPYTTQSRIEAFGIATDRMLDSGEQAVVIEVYTKDDGTPIRAARIVVEAVREFKDGKNIPANWLET